MADWQAFNYIITYIITSHNTLKVFRLLLAPDHVMLAVQYLKMMGYDNMTRHSPQLLVA